MSEVRRYWIYKGTSNFCEELIPDDNCENMVKQKPDGFYDIVSTADTIEGGVEVVLASDYENLKAQLERAEELLSHSDELLTRTIESHKYSLDNQLNLVASNQYGYLFLLDESGRMIFKLTKEKRLAEEIKEYFKEKEQK